VAPPLAGAARDGDERIETTLARPAFDDDRRIEELRLRAILRLDGERVAARLDELLAAFDADPADDNHAALMKAATHLRVTGSKRDYLRTVVRSLQEVANRPTLWTCEGCGTRVLTELCGRAYCLPCGRALAPNTRRGAAS
jgi:hypothetical protein